MLLILLLEFSSLSFIFNKCERNFKFKKDIKIVRGKFQIYKRFYN